MKNSIRFMAIMTMLILMVSCEDVRTIPYDPPDDYPELLLGEWLLVDKDGVQADDPFSTIYNEDSTEVHANAIKTIYLFSPDNTGFKEQTFEYVADGFTETKETNFTWEIDLFTLTMDIDHVDVTLATGIHFRNDNELFCDFLHVDDRENQTHLNRNR